MGGALVVMSLSCCLLISVIAEATPGNQGRADPAVSRAWEFVETVISTDFSAFLRLHRPAPVTPADHAKTIADLPTEGELVPTAAERAKLAALHPVFEVYGRQGAIWVKVVDVESASVAVAGRAVILISREALTLVNAAELQAIGAHELAHEYFWDDYNAALNGNAYERLQELELRCDAIAVMTLRVLGVDATHLARAVAKVVRHNERIHILTSTQRHVSLQARLTFIKDVDTRLSRHQRSQ